MVQARDICSVRKRLRLSQEELAEALGVSRNTISRWERGKSDPSAENLTALDGLLARLENRNAPEAGPKAEDYPAPAPARAGRWPMAVLCAGVVCALLIGLAALIGVYSIRRQLDPTDSAAPIEEAELEGEEVDGLPTMSITLPS